MEKVLNKIFIILSIVTFIVFTIIMVTNNNAKAVTYENQELPGNSVVAIPALEPKESLKPQETQLIESLESKTQDDVLTKLEIEEVPCTDYEVDNDRRKSYMDYTKITLKSSKQYELQQSAYTNSNGLRMVDGRYCIAVGSYYTTTVGTLIDVILENGTIIPCILGDLKKNRDTKNNHKLGTDGGAVEFIVETSKLNHESRFHGDVSYSTDGWLSNVAHIKVY